MISPYALSHSLVHFHLHYCDAGLLASLKALTPERLHIDRTPFGPVLETFVLGELLKLASWADDRYAFSHFRDKERNEVDIVIEDGLGRIVGVEVKASATVSAGDLPVCAASRPPPATASPWAWSFTTTSTPCRSESEWPPCRYQRYGHD